VTKKNIGITTTVPIEIPLAAGYSPIDLNNLFIGDPSPERLVRIAEQDGFPQNCCTWIKGIYGACRSYNINPVICVTNGDCSNTIMLMEVLQLKGFETIAFAYPDTPNYFRMRYCLESLAESLGTTVEEAESVKEGLATCRELTSHLDELTWKKGVISGWENHRWLVSCSDFNSDYATYEKNLRHLLQECQDRQSYSEDMLRLAFIGVPPLFAQDLYHSIERYGALVVFNEVQRQFAMPQPGDSLSQQYTNYTYPYSISDRLNDILPELDRRQVTGVIHYIQAFCHRGIADIVFRNSIRLPVLTLEGNNDYILSQQLQTKIEAFLDMVRRRQDVSNRGEKEMEGNLHG